MEIYESNKGIIDDTTYSDDPLYRVIVFDNYENAKRWYDEEADGYGVDKTLGQAQWFNKPGAYRVELGYDPDEADMYEVRRVVRRGDNIPPVSDYAHWNEDAYAMWYEENKYDMMYADEIVEEYDY